MDAEEEEWRAKMAKDDDTFMPQLPELADFKFRSELIRLMGSDRILVSDSYWNTKLIKALRDDYERQLNDVEANLREVERKRMKKLLLKGFIHVPDDSRVSFKDGGPTSASSSRKPSTSRKTSASP
ncbi:uncharacterized protein [Littorina saxatilis]|uniref:Uncharacterized protein n=1 Tax=Littorina saxatilis TaxID=31220 RepID=A0AAN9G4D6_9CAEN